MTTQPIDAVRGSFICRKFRLILIALAILLFAASITANGLLYRQVQSNYRSLSETQLDPYGLKYAAFPADVPTDGISEQLPAVLFFGDSRARDWPAPAIAGYRIVNRGIGGQTTEQVRGRLDAHVTPLSPRIVVIQAGINDLKAIPLLPHRRNQIVADCRDNLRYMVNRARDHGATVVVSTIFPPGDVPLQRQMVWSSDIEKAVEEVNTAVRGWASDRVLVLDAWKVLAVDGRLRDGYGLDTLHLNPTGYAVLNTELETALRAMQSSGTR